VRLQLESMVAIAAITGRTLVLPPPGHHDHVKDPYFEFDIFDAANLTKVIPVKIDMAPDDSVLRVNQELSQVDIRQLDKERDWLFPMQQSRIQHFECLKLNEHDQALAAHAVLRGVALEPKFEEMATSDLKKLGLADSAAGFDCAHIRRGDFKKFAPQFFLEDTQLAARLRDLSLGRGGRPVLVASDERPELELGTKVVHSSDAYEAGVPAQTRLLVDMVMCSRAEDFVGSPMSTFTNGILELRRRHALLAAHAGGTTEAALLRTSDSLPATRLYAGEAEFASSQGTCWNKQTTFEALKSCQDDAPSCFTSCPDHFL